MDEISAPALGEIPAPALGKNSSAGRALPAVFTTAGRAVPAVFCTAGTPPASAGPAGHKKNPAVLLKLKLPDKIDNSHKHYKNIDHWKTLSFYKGFDLRKSSQLRRYCAKHNAESVDRLIK